MADRINLPQESIMSAPMTFQVFPRFLVSQELVYCSDKRNNVNIMFEHAVGAVPFELTRIIIKV
jgi:hypothetical protein